MLEGDLVLEDLKPDAFYCESMGCVCVKPLFNEVSKSPRAVPINSTLPLVDPVHVIAEAKLSAAVSSSGQEIVAVSWTAAERKRDVGARRERQVYPSNRHVWFSGSIPMGLQGEQVAAGWPAWLAAVGGEAIHGWVPRQAESFEKLDKIGQGTYSNVYKARDLDNGKIVALKKVRFDSLEPESVRFMAREIHVLRRLDHPNVIKLQGLVASRMSCSLYLIFEYMEHDLAGLVSYSGIKFTEPQIKCYMQQLLSGLNHCHSRSVLHRDIKGSNLLIDNNGVLKIADFGLASFFDPKQQQPLTSRVVTLWYRPPELLLGATSYGVSVDLWSTGCILAELYAGKPVMPGRTEVEQLHKIFKLCGSPADDYWIKSKLPHATIFKPQQPYPRRLAEAFKDFPAPALQLVETLLSVDPADRGTASSALSSEFFMTDPLPCDPSTLPHYPPSKEFDAKVRNEARRLDSGGGKAQKLDPEVKAVGAQNADLSMSLKGQFVGFPQDPPRLSSVATETDELSQRHYYPHKISHSGPVTSRGQLPIKAIMNDDLLKLASAANIPALSDLVAATQDTLFDGSENEGSRLENSVVDGGLLEFENSHSGRRCDPEEGPNQKEDEKDRCMNHSQRFLQSQGFGPKEKKIHYSGPLLRSSGNVDQMLRDHDRQIQDVIRRARIDRSKIRKNQIEGGPTGPNVRPYNPNVGPIYPSSRSSVIVFTTSRGASMRQQQ